jgi:hypothetical protein
MRSPHLALLWQTWGRHRWGLALALAGLLSLVGLHWALPSGLGLGVEPTSLTLRVQGSQPEEAEVMHSPTQALAWQLWRRDRWMLTAAFVYLLLLSAGCRALPDGALAESLGWRTVFPFVPVFLALFTVFTYTRENNPEVRPSDFPARMFTLPVCAAVLVAWPLLHGTLGLMLTWVAVVGLVLRPCGIAIPLWWPAALLAAVLAALQAITWWPFAWPMLRLPVALLVLGAAAGAPFLAPPNETGEVLLTAGFAGCTPVAYAVAVAGVARARRGEALGVPWSGRLVAGLWPRFGQRAAPFASPARAQLWFEWRRHGVVLPAFMTWPLLFLSAMSLFDRGEKTTLLLLIGASLFLVPLMAGIVGAGLGKSDFWAKDLRLAPFLATRPITSGALVLAKLQVAAVSTLAAWALVLIATVLWLALLGDLPEMGRRASLLLQAYPALRVGAVVLLAAAGLFLFTWKLMVESLCIILTGRPWIANSGYLLGLTLWGFVLPVGFVISNRPEYLTLLQPWLQLWLPLFWTLVPWLAGALVLFKLLLAGWAFHAVRRRRLLAPRALACLVGLWLLVAVGLFGLLSYLVPAELAPAHYLALGVVLLLPLARLLVAPLALAWNRHR